MKDKMDKIIVVQKAIITNKNKILIIQRAKDDSQGGLWDFPGGKLEFLEKMQNGIKREIQEEVGLKIKNLREILLQEVIIEKHRRHFIFVLYIADSDSSQIKLSEEHENYAWIKKDQLKNYKLNRLLSLTEKSWKKLI